MILEDNTQANETEAKLETEKQTEEERKELPYECPPELHLPPGMVVPLSEKQAARIEVTAIFIARHDTQMEIVLKAKQAKNPQFQFLNYDSDLNAFYKELVKQIKSGRYIPRPRKAAEGSMFGPAGQTDASHNDRVGHFLFILDQTDGSKTSVIEFVRHFKRRSFQNNSPLSITTQNYQYRFLIFF